MNQKTTTITTKNLILLCLALFAFSWLLYANSLTNGFAFDDKSLVINNKFVNESYTLGRIFSTTYREGVGFTGDSLYRPVVILSFVLNKGEKLDAFPYHFVNITLNACNGFLLFLLLYFLTGQVNIAFFSALIFSFHPIHTEAVANIAGRPELFCAFFLFLSWIAFEKTKSLMISYCVGSLSFLAALMSKETAIMLPFMIVAIDLIKSRPLKDRRMLFKYGSLMFTAVLYLVIRWLVLKDKQGLNPEFVDNPIAQSPVMERLSTAFAVFVRYMYLMLAPYRLSSDYSYNQIPLQQSFLNIVPLVGLVLFISLLSLAFYLRKTNKIYTTGLIIFLFPYLLVSNIFFPIGTIMGERLMYIPSAGFSLMTGWLIVYAFNKWRSVTVFFLGIIFLLFSVKIYKRNQEWYDDFSLFSADRKNSSQSVKVLSNLAFLAGNNGDYKTAMSLYREALGIFPEYDAGLRGLGKKYYDLKQYDESVKYYAKAVNLYPKRADLLYDYATVLEKLGRFTEAESKLMIAIRLDPSSPKMYEEMGTVKIALGEYKSAILYLLKAIELGGNMQLILNNLAAANYFNGDYLEAYKYVQKAEEIGVRLNQDMVNTIKSQIKNITPQ
ncbi:MAG: tetratricopeptide repeat protein [Candidatus Latescibacteria bacterium]|nr:tetratricopeptide repeat protein [Candidatus Latescibacterota bacterium]